MHIEDDLAETSKIVSNYLKFIQSGNYSEAVVKGLAESEAKMKKLNIEKDYLASQIDNKLFITPLAIKNRLMSLTDILSDRIVAANEILKRIFYNKILLTPKIGGSKKHYVASGQINLYGLVSNPDRLPSPGVEMPFIKFEIDVK